MRSRCPIEQVRARAYNDPQFASAYRRGAADLGCYSMLVPPALGGGTVSGNGMVDAALLACTRGELLQPGPFVGTNVLAYAIGAAGSAGQRDEVLPSLLSGERTGTWALTASGREDEPWDGVWAVPSAAGYTLTGHKTGVQDVESDTWLLVTVGTAEGPAQFVISADTPGLRVTPLESLDVSRRFYEIDLDGVTVPTSAQLPAGGAAEDLISQQVAVAAVLTAAESVGAMEHDLAMAVQYAKDRIAFGRPIGSFQAIKHLLADSSLTLEMSSAAMTAAARHLGDVDDYARESASIAKAFVGDSGASLAQNCFQVFGGIGFTWEHDQHLYLRRLTSDAALFGSPRWHRERLCQLSGL